MGTGLGTAETWGEREGREGTAHTQTRGTSADAGRPELPRETPRLHHTVQRGLRHVCVCTPSLRPITATVPVLLRLRAQVRLGKGVHPSAEPGFKKRMKHVGIQNLKDNSGGLLGHALTGLRHQGSRRGP